MKVITSNKICKSFEKKRYSFRNFLKPEITVKNAITDLDLEIMEGEFVGFLGPNGAGKTTFLKILTGIMHPTSGEAEVLGYTPWQRNYKYLKQIAIVMGQKNQLWWDIPAIDSFNLLREVYSIPEKQYKTNLDRMVDMLGMHNLVNSRLREMSLGERMKCELTACFLHNPRVIFLDEPTIGLDVVSARAIRVFLKQINKDNGCTVILTSHYMADIEELCQRIFIINKGKKVYDGDIKELLSKFSSEKIVKVVLNDVSDRQKFSRLHHKKSLLDGDGIIRCSNSQIATVAKDLFDLFPAENIAINNVDIEEVITKMFDQR
ncbi:MAG: putative ABC transporter ATP-binding protein YbhF [bacterium ADurb.Bin212]|nr:MAG: putative ABC transporter ATP-binding protein YbhF [bacterium ADurb.Bin212]